MALRRRDFLSLAPTAAGLILGCSGAGPTASKGGYAELRNAGRGSKSILVFMPDTTQTEEVWSGLADELGNDFVLTAVRVDERSSASAIAQGISRHAPAGVILMNNPTVAAYRDYQRQAKSDRFPPAVIVMTSFLEGKPQGVRAATGISYEVPLITVVTNLRKLIATPAERVGVIHRPQFSHYVERQARLAKREQTAVFNVQVGQDPNPSELKWALRKLKQHADVVWILNDDQLLTPRLIAEGWLPELNERPWIPTIVGAASLVSPKQSFGTFAVLPDHTALGVQAADLVFDIADNGWTVDQDQSVQLPLSTLTVIDLAQVRERFSLRPEALRQVDRILDV